jgi:branched-chain amino acid transport system substrate-binding protein
MTLKRDNVLLAVSFLVAVAVFAGAGSILWRYSTGSRPGLSPSPTLASTEEVKPTSIQSRISSGERILSHQEGDAKKPAFEQAKNQGVKAIADKKYVLAAEKLKSALSIYPNAPETLIYLSNALISDDDKTYTIAVSTPLDDKQDGLAVLRGVAQAQKEINESGGINGIRLKVLIADDDNQGAIAQQIASDLAKNPEVLGVIGHYSSSTTLAAKEVYDREKLPVISSTSSSVELSKKDYVFRTIPNDASAASALAEYMLNTSKRQKVAVFFDDAPQSSYSRSLSSTFIREVEQNNGTVVAQFDFSKADFDPAESVKQAIQSGAEVLMFAASTDNYSDVYKVIESNNGQLDLLGGDELYTFQMLKNDEVQDFGKFSTNMVVSVAWDSLVTPDPANDDSEFNNRAEQLWRGKINGDNALTYDATKVLAEAIKRAPSREGIYKALLDTNFSTPGASRPVRFTSEGDRIGKAYLFQIKSGSSPRYSSSTGYDFIPIDP